jgi:hypothetical protein
MQLDLSAVSSDSARIVRQMRGVILPSFADGREPDVQKELRWRGV